MTDDTIVAVYDTPAHAELAVQDLKASGVPDSAISVHAASTSASAVTLEQPREQGFWSSLFGGEPDHDTAVYERSVASGSTVVTVKVADRQVAGVMDILESHKPIDIDERASGYGMAAVAPVAPMATVAPIAAVGTVATGASETLQLAEERLSVGKRLVNRGGTRIRRFVVETPVEEQITLRDEKVTLERRPVSDGRPVSAVDFTDKTIEMTASGEEAVVAKTAHVTEEISLRKVATEHVETIHDTVRREDVQIEQVAGEKLAAAVPPAKI